MKVVKMLRKILFISIYVGLIFGALIGGIPWNWMIALASLYIGFAMILVAYVYAFPISKFKLWLNKLIEDRELRLWQKHCGAVGHYWRRKRFINHDIKVCGRCGLIDDVQM